MFREVTRYKQALSEEECLEILKNEKRGVLSVLGDDGYPYGMPIDHWYSEKDGHIYFHTGKKGHRTDAIRRCDKVSYCVYDEGFLREGEWALNIKSVIVFGRIRIVEDHEEALRICRELSYKFTEDTDYIEREVRKSGPGVMVLELIPEHITGKIVNES